jgi:hypothetical protein
MAWHSQVSQGSLKAAVRAAMDLIEKLPTILPTAGVGRIVVDRSPPAWFATPNAGPMTDPNDKTRVRRLPKAGVPPVTGNERTTAASGNF